MTYTEVTVPRRHGNATLSGGVMVACGDCGHVKSYLWGQPMWSGEART